MKSNVEYISDYIQENIRLKEEILKTKVEKINQVAEVIIDAFNQDNKVVWFGNGGSAADAQHLACELVSKFNLERKALPSISLTTNTSELTAIANDYDYSQVFSKQVEALVNKGDVIVGITTSGRSQNVIKALKKGREIGSINVALTGQNIDAIKDFVDYLVDVPSIKTPLVQESHIMIGHIICDLVEKTIFADSD